MPPAIPCRKRIGYLGSDFAIETQYGFRLNVWKENRNCNRIETWSGSGSARAARSGKEFRKRSS